jgi:hypothetical protein
MIVDECTEKTNREELGGVYVGDVGCAHTPTYTGPPLSVDLFSVDSFDIRVRFPMKPEKARLPGEVFPTAEMWQPTINLGERLIRIVLVTGFVIVIAIEIWLLFEAFRLWM